jgi:hypothetical protein
MKVEMSRSTVPVVENELKIRDLVGEGFSHSFHPGLPVTAGATA